MQPAGQLFLTGLPNGRTKPDGGKTSLRISLLLTPSLEKGQLSAPFLSWPDLAKTLRWTVTFFKSDHKDIMSTPTPRQPSVNLSTPLKTRVDPDGSLDFDAELWKTIFGTDTKVEKRQASNHLHRTWRLSHNITELHHRHQLNQLSHAYRQIAPRAGFDFGASVDELHASTVPPPLFLHPEFKNDEKNSDLSVKYDDRNRVIERWPALVGSLPQANVIKQRVIYAIGQLEDYGSAKLSAVSLAAVYISSLQSAAPAGSKDDGINNAINTIHGWLTDRETTLSTDYPKVETVIHYTQTLLFHRRILEQTKVDRIDRPDFHQLLGLLHSYPAAMRRLGLIYDLVLDPPDGLPEPCCFRVDPDPDDMAKLPAISGPIYTQCTLMSDDFFATPEEQKLIQHGLLNLNQPGGTRGRRFNLVAQNADGQALKLTDRVNNAARGREFSSSAPTAMNLPAALAPSTNGLTVRAPHSSANPVISFPAPRTVGLALFDQDRLSKLEDSVRKYPETPEGGTPAPPKDLFAEDIVLGYRVDVLYKKNFYSLCRRKSTYDVFKPRTDEKVSCFNPSTPMELRSDEGYVSFGATQSAVDPNRKEKDSSNTQTHVHQAVFTWTGWSLSVPQPNFPLMNPPEKKNTSADSKHLAIRPCYELDPCTKLPPLRFNTEYAVRCRVVDLAGNSAPPELDPANEKYEALTAAPVTPFSRHEPIRAPQFLLLKPIDRKEEPGTHIDRMVARDNGKGSSRMLVPPRESLRLAELTGALKNDKLPETAFADQQLLPDGSFPSVACAKEQNWIKGTVDDNDPADLDPIFLGNIDHNRVVNPYYPDPLANYIRVEAFQLTDDLTQAIRIDVKPVGGDPRPAAWLNIANNQKWPKRLPVRIRLAPRSANKPLSIEADSKDRVPTLEVKLPEACTVVLRISTAAIEDAHQEQKTANAPADSQTTEALDYDFHLSHLLRLSLQNPKSLNPQGDESIGNALNDLHLSAQKIPGRSPHSAMFVDGSLDITTPSRTMTLVHAVKQPLDPPQFAPIGSAGMLQVKRDPGKAEAKVTGQLRAHWPSTGKITCYAEWTDRVDDVTRSSPTEIHHREVAFVATAKDFKQDVPDPANRLRTLTDLIFHHFHDTRAHDVTYTLVASTNFREYYPGAGNATGSDEKNFQQEGDGSVKLTVLSSVRPLAPSIAYVIPAFVWNDTYDKATKTWYAGRRVVLRVYLERPFLGSGDRETLGVVIFHPSSGVDPANQNFVSRWGADPTRPITTPILHNELSEANLCEPGLEVQECHLAEGDLARIKPCLINYSEDRKLWFADIPIDTQHANAPFVRLALVRWQPDALGGNDEAHCSHVVFAEFMQIAPDRWVSIQKQHHSKYTIVVSGVFPNDPSRKCLLLKLQKRWYALGSDTGWREVQPKKPVVFTYSPPNDKGISNWTAELETPGSAHLAKYRIFLSEEEFPGQEQRKLFSIFVDLP